MRKAKNWNQPCPNTTCTHSGQKNQGNLCSIASYMTQSGKRRVFKCITYGDQFSETRDTVLFDLRTPEDKVMMTLKMILVRVSLSNISFVLGMTEETVLAWLKRAARTQSRWPVKVTSCSPVAASQMRAVLSWEAVTMWLQSQLKPASTTASP